MKSKSTFKGEFATGGEFSFTENKVYDFIELQGFYFISDDNRKAVKFSREHMLENFYYNQ